jgi:hypothetical protein
MSRNLVIKENIHNLEQWLLKCGTRPPHKKQKVNFGAKEHENNLFVIV